MSKPVKKAPAKKKAKAAHTSQFDLPLAPVIRIAKRSGAVRISMGGTRAIVVSTEEYIAAIAREAAHSAASDGRKTIRAEDIEKY